MAQRNPTPITPDVDLVPSETALTARDPLSGAIQRPHVPTRTQLMAERQATAMLFQAARSALAISKSVEVVDHANAEATASLLYAHHLERGFGDDLTAEEREFFADMRQLAMDASGAIAGEAAEALRALARKRGLPSADVTRLDVVVRWLLTH
jgi:hypothetical protein